MEVLIKSPSHASNRSRVHLLIGSSEELRQLSKRYEDAIKNFYFVRVETLWRRKFACEMTGLKLVSIFFIALEKEKRARIEKKYVLLFDGFYKVYEVCLLDIYARIISRCWSDTIGVARYKFKDERT